MKKITSILTLLLLVGFQVNAQEVPPPPVTINTLPSANSTDNLDRSQVYQVLNNGYQPMSTGWNTPWGNYPNQQFMYWDQGSNGWRIFVAVLNIGTNIINFIDAITRGNINPYPYGINQQNGWLGGGATQ